MNTIEFISYRGQNALERCESREARTAEVRHFTRRSLSEWLNQIREPWREYGARRPDDMPPRNGDRAAMKRVFNDPEIEIESFSKEPE
jgi:hypothetical protein